MRHQTHLIIILLLTLSGCWKQGPKICDTQNGYVGIRQYCDSISEIYHVVGDDTISRWELPYRIYRVDYGDLLGNGENEILIGTIRATKYWHQEDKRLFIYKLYKGRLIRPLWLGSRLWHPIKDFHVERDSMPARVIAEEYETADSIIQVMYRYKGFGLKYEKTINHK